MYLIESLVFKQFRYISLCKLINNGLAFCMILYNFYMLRVSLCVFIASPCFYLSGSNGLFSQNCDIEMSKELPRRPDLLLPGHGAAGDWI